MPSAIFSGEEIALNLSLKKLRNPIERIGYDGMIRQLSTDDRYPPPHFCFREKNKVREN
jgi:hypothetical protein